jgi:hypothetical protein
MEVVTMVRSIRLLLAVLLLVALAVPPGVAAEGRSAPAAACQYSWAGSWTTTYGTMVLTQEGSAVRGTYANGAATIEGTASGRKLIGKWHRDRVTKPSGPIEFTMNEDGSKFEGTWSYDEDPRPRTWTGERLSGGGCYQISGTVRNDAGEPVQRVKIELVTGAGAATTRTTAKGEYRFEKLRSGRRYTVRTERGYCVEGPEQCVRGRTFVNLAGDEVVDFREELYTLAGKIVDADGTPRYGEDIALRSDDRVNAPFAHDEAQQNGSWAFVVPRGDYTVLGPGKRGAVSSVFVDRDMKGIRLVARPDLYLNRDPSRSRIILVLSSPPYSGGRFSVIIRRRPSSILCASSAILFQDFQQIPYGQGDPVDVLRFDFRPPLAETFCQGQWVATAKWNTRGEILCTFPFTVP